MISGWAYKKEGELNYTIFKDELPKTVIELMKRAGLEVVPVVMVDISPACEDGLCNCRLTSGDPETYTGKECVLGMSVPAKPIDEGNGKVWQFCKPGPECPAHKEDDHES